MTAATQAHAAHTKDNLVSSLEAVRDDLWESANGLQEFIDAVKAQPSSRLRGGHLLPGNVAMAILRARDLGAVLPAGNAVGHAATLAALPAVEL